MPDDRNRHLPEDVPGLPAMAGSVPFVHGLDTAPADWWLDILWLVLATPGDTSGRYSLMHETLPKGSGAPPHNPSGPMSTSTSSTARCRFLWARTS